STQKKDFLRSLTNAMMTELFEKKNFAVDKLIQQGEASIRQKHMLFAFSDPGIQNVFSVTGLSSALLDTRSKEKNTFLDFFSAIDANVGTNKDNYYVKRAITQDIRFDSTGGQQVTAEVVYTNTSGKDSPFGGDYKNYLRFLLPQDAILQSVYF